jgi:glycosyltransferase involved in cell wall biosynthesis
MKIALVTDAWVPQVNGVVRTLQHMVRMLEADGYEVAVISPEKFRTIACPGYPEIRLVCAPWKLGRMMQDFAPERVHIATEGPLGWAARRWCKRHGIGFNTSFHTRFPDYIAVRTGIPARWIWPIMRHFHAPSNHVLVATQRLEEELHTHKIMRTHRWTRGVDLARFTPDTDAAPLFTELARPVQLYVGRVAVEKNIEAFLSNSHKGSKVVVGDGPALAELRGRFPDALFMGTLEGKALAHAYACADVFVFPSLTDTFGLVMIEALASGLPVAAFPVHGPLDIVGEGGRGTMAGFSKPIGALDEDLSNAIAQALLCDKQDCRDYARYYDWKHSYAQFIAALFAISGENSHKG